MVLEWQDMLLRLGMALLLGSAIGFERQIRQKMAGLRTNALVALGAGGFVAFSSLFGASDSPTRMAAQVVSGIRFLGAGVILREGINVHGLNTAATLWCAAMVGTFAGAGFYIPSTAAAGFVIVANLLLRPVVRVINRQTVISSELEAHYTVEVKCLAAEGARARSLVLHALTGQGLGLKKIDSADIPESGQVMVTAVAVTGKRNDAALEQVVGQLSLEPFVSAVRWQVDSHLPEF